MSDALTGYSAIDPATFRIRSLPMLLSIRPRR
jgi:hypothetical protein